MGERAPAADEKGMHGQEGLNQVRSDTARHEALSITCN